MVYNHARQAVRQWNGADESLCPLCDAVLIPKRGDYIAWHWAHKPISHGRSSCPYEESTWHLRWKYIHLNEDHWNIEVPVTIGSQRFIVDAMHVETRQIREFVHSLSPYYAEKHQRLRSAGYQVLWIFDGNVFMSARRKFTRTGGLKNLLKPIAYDIAKYLNAVVHEWEHGLPEMQCFWKRWQKADVNNIWFPVHSDISTYLLQRFAGFLQIEHC